MFDAEERGSVSSQIAVMLLEMVPLITVPFSAAVLEHLT